MSADDVRRLEQGRSHPSAGVVKAIARALRVGRADYERLCALAGYAAVDGQVPTEIGPGAMRLLERAVSIADHSSDALSCQAGKELLGGGSVHLAQPLRVGAVVGVQAVVEACAPVRVCVRKIAAVEDVARLRERQK